MAGVALFTTDNDLACVALFAVAALFAVIALVGVRPLKVQVGKSQVDFASYTNEALTRRVEAGDETASAIMLEAKDAYEADAMPWAAHVAGLRRSALEELRVALAVAAPGTEEREVGGQRVLAFPGGRQAAVFLGEAGDLGAAEAFVRAHPGDLALLVLLGGAAPQGPVPDEVVVATWSEDESSSQRVLGLRAAVEALARRAGAPSAQ